MKNTKTLLFLAVVCAFAAGCANTMSGFGTYQEERQQRQSQRDQLRLREQNERRQLQYNADTALSAARDAESRLNQFEMRLERLEASSRTAASAVSYADIDALRRENDALRAQIADTKASQEQMRSEILANVQSLLKEQQRRAAASAPKQQQQSESGYEHKVEPGQTLSQIASAYGVSVDKIKKANKMSGDIIRVGQVLFIPE